MAWPSAWSPRWPCTSRSPVLRNSLNTRRQRIAMSPIPTDTYSSAAPQPKQSLLGIGGPLFNAMLIMTLMAISFAAVALPERSEDLATAAPSVLTPPTTVQTALPETTTSTTTEPVDRMAALLGAVSTSDLPLDTFPAETVPGPSAATESSTCLLYTSPSPRGATLSRMPSSA